MQLGSPLKPVTVKTAGAASLALVGLGRATLPLAQLRVTLTVVVSVPGLSEKSLRTVKVAPLRVLVIVQLALPLAGRLAGAVQPLAV